MIVFRERKWLCRYSVHKDFRGQTCWFSDEKIDFLLTSSGVIFIWIMETLWIHFTYENYFAKHTLCNQYTISRRRPVVQRPSRLKSKISRTPAGWPSQRGTHLSNFDDSSILVRRIAVIVSENFEKCEDFWKVTFRAPICLLLSVLCSLLLSRRKAGEPASLANTKAHPRKHLMINSWFCFAPPSLNRHLRPPTPNDSKKVGFANHLF